MQLLRRTGRWLGRGLLALIALLLLAWGWSAAHKAAAQRQIWGRLSFDQAQLASFNATIGRFEVGWDSTLGQLRITPADQPERVIWSSVPGQSFVAAAQGQERVAESRGSFFVSDALTTICPHQQITGIAATSTALTVSGELLCERPDAGSQRYSLTFAALGDQQLHFDLHVYNPSFNRTYFSYTSRPDEHFFGFGEQFTYVDMRGKRLPIFVMEQGIGRGAQPITAGADVQARAGGSWHTSYAGVPQYISSEHRGLFLETYEYSVFDMRDPRRLQITLFSNRLTGQLLIGDSPKQLIELYTASTGRMRRLPDWILQGAIIGMQGGTEKVRQVWQELRSRNTPVAAFWLQDWVGQRTTSFGKQLWWNWELDAERYPQWQQLVGDLGSAGVRTLTYINPFLVDVSDKPNARRNLFAEARDQGFLVMQSDGQPYLIQNTSFSAGLLDLTNPAARAWMQDVIRDEVLAVGASGWMADFGEALPYDAVLNQAISAKSYHNQYPEEWAKLNRAVVDGQPNGDDLVFFMRSGYRASPGAATLFWEGDQLVSWDEYDGLKSAVTGLLSGGFSGFSLNHSDIGGYTTITSPIADYHRSAELLERWTELCAFTTIFRTHEGNQPDNNVQIYSTPATLDHFSRMAKVYAAWGDYRRQLVDEAAATGVPVVRHMYIEFPSDPNVYDLRTQFMLGSELLVAPVLDPGVTSVSAYLPAGQWVNVWSGQTYGDPRQGGRVSIPAPIGQPAVLYRAGSPVGEQLTANLRSAGLLK